MRQTFEAWSRRQFLGAGSLVGVGALSGTMELARAEKEKKPKSEEEITPTEDLMREHGVLYRLLLIYEDAIPRLQREGDYPMDVLAAAVDINRRFIEEYHERDEERYIFPHFEKAGTMTELVQVLRKQHDAGRRATDRTLAGVTAETLNSPEKRKNLAEYLEMYSCMYHPHAAREATVLFPAFQTLLSEKEIKALGEQFEKEEQKLFGEKGFEKIVEQIAGMERKLGLYELKQYTPPV